MLKNKIVNGTILNLLYQFFNGMQQIILVPLFLKVWGIEIYSEWILLFAFVAYFGLVDVGFQTYSINKMTKAHINSIQKQYDKYLAIIFYLYGLVLLFLLVLYILLHLLNTNILLDIKYFSAYDFYLILAIIVFDVFLTMISLLQWGIYRSIDRYNLGLIHKNIFIISKILFIFLGLYYFDSSPLQVAIIILVSHILVITISWYDIIRIKKVSIKFISVSLHDIKETFFQGSFFFLQKLSNIINIQGTLLILQKMSTPTNLVSFVLIRTLSNLIHQVRFSYLNTLWVDIIKFDKESDEIGKILSSSLITSLCLSIYLGTLLLLFSHEIFILWNIDESLLDEKLLIIYTIYIVIQSFWVAFSIFPSALNDPKFLGITSVLASLLMIIFAILFFNLFSYYAIPIFSTLFEFYILYRLWHWIKNRYKIIICNQLYYTVGILLSYIIIGYLITYYHNLLYIKVIYGLLPIIIITSLNKRKKKDVYNRYKLFKRT